MLLGERKKLILPVLLIYLYNIVYTLHNQKMQGNTCYLIKNFLQVLNHLTMTVSCLVECSRPGSYFLSPLLKVWGRWVLFSKLSKRWNKARASRLLVLKGGLVQIGWNFAILLERVPKTISHLVYNICKPIDLKLVLIK